MDARRLRILREFADRGTVGEVADAMNLTPSAVSQQLKVLAQEAGVQLLVQDGRRIRLTEAGSALVIRADEVIAAVQRAAEEMTSYREGSHPTVRIAVFPSGGALLLPGVLAELGGGVQVDATDEDVTYPTSPELLADYDVVLTHRDERAPQIRAPRVAARQVMREPIDLVVDADHRLAGQQSVRLADLTDETWISVRGGWPVDDVLVSLTAATGMAPRVRFRFNDFQVIEAMVAGGHGVALMPRYAIRNPDVVRLAITGVRAARAYELLSRPDAERRPAVRTVMTLLTERARQVESGARDGNSSIPNR